MRDPRQLVLGHRGQRRVLSARLRERLCGVGVDRMPTAVALDPVLPGTGIGVVAQIEMEGYASGGRHGDPFVDRHVALFDPDSPGITCAFDPPKPNNWRSW